MKYANKEEMNRLFSYAEEDMDLKQIALVEHISTHCAKKKYQKYFGVSFTSLRLVISYLAALESIDNKYLQSSAVCIIEKSKINISVPKSLYTRIGKTFHTTHGSINRNLKMMKGDITMRKVINLTRTDKIIIAQVLAKLQESSKKSPITLTSISDSFGYKKANVRRAIVWLRRLGVPVVSRPGRYYGGYFLATKGFEAAEECICCSWINNLRKARWQIPALRALFGWEANTCI